MLTAMIQHREHLIPSVRLPILPPLILGRKAIEEILDYVKKREQRPVNAHVNSHYIIAKLKCQKPTYTVRPVKYLSSSELMIGIAQTAQILLDCYVQHEGSLYNGHIGRERLKELREDHQIYFTDMSFRFRRKIPAADYHLKIELLKFKAVSRIVIAQCQFNVDKSLVGSFKACLPYA